MLTETQIEGEVIHVVVSACFNLNELMSPEFEGRNLGSMQSPVGPDKKNAETVVQKEKPKVLQGELFPSRDFK